VNKQRRSKKQAGAGQSGGRNFGAIFRNVCIVLFILIALPVGYLGAKIYQQLRDMPDISALEKYEPIEAIQVFDKNDHLICTVEGDEDRRVVPLSQVSTQMQQAILAAEDHHFYEHHGINPFSLARATLVNLQAHRVVEGGSTITQQLIKNLFFEDAGRTFDRKIKEAFMSSEVERRYPKERILEMYLNQVYFGNGGYGIERAAQRYFDRSAASLDLAQGAFLAGLVKAPSELAANREAAIARQREILDRMVEFGYVTRGQADKAKQEKLVFKKAVNPLQKFPYYVSLVLDQLRGRFSEAEMRRQGLKVYTNLDPQVQDLAEKTLNADLKKAPKGVSQAALVCVSVKDGAVIALVGGVGDYWKNQFNRATNPHTAGSSFKPFVYLTAFLRNIFRPDSIIDDSPLTIKQGWGLPDWSPKNFDHKFMGKITIRKALANSRNVPAVRVGKAVGIDNVVETARLAGITTKLDPNLSLSLGSSAVTPFDMAGAYATFARGGIAIKPHVLRRIENNRGRIIETFESKVDKVFDSDATAKLVDVMQDVVRAGTGTAARLPDRPVAGKTGTADAGKDIWFCGFTPDTACCVWGGNDENLPIPGHNVTGGVVMAKIWKDFMTAYYSMRPAPPGAFMAPAKRIDDLDTQGSGGETTTNGGLPKLVPLNGEEPAADTNSQTTPAWDEHGAPPPAVSPSNSIPDESPPPLAPLNTPQPGKAAPPNPLYMPSSNTVPQMPVPAPGPSAAVPAVMPPVAPSYSTAGRISPPSVVMTADGRAKRTVVNEEAPQRYPSLTDPSTNPGLTGRRFSRSGTAQPGAVPSGTGF
jgi:penicillin-binding protein 1A